MLSKINVGEVRIWKEDMNNEFFKVIKYKSFFLGEHYYTIEYLNDNREQVVSKDELLTGSVLFEQRR